MENGCGVEINGGAFACTITECEKKKDLVINVYRDRLRNLWILIAVYNPVNNLYDPNPSMPQIISNRNHNLKTTKYPALFSGLFYNFRFAN